MSNDDDLQIIQSNDGLVADVRSMIAQTSEGVARTVNAGMTLLCWRIGKRIQTEVPGNERAEFGKEIVPTLSAQLGEGFGRGFSYTALTRMVKFAEIVATLSQQLGWSHYKEITSSNSPSPPVPSPTGIRKDQGIRLRIEASVIRKFRTTAVVDQTRKGVRA